MLTNFNHITTLHQSLGGLEHMERPPRSFGRKLDPATLGIQWPTGSGQGSCIKELHSMSAVSAISSMLLPHSLSVLKPESMAFLESSDRLGMQMSRLRAFDWFCSMQVWIPVHKPQHVDLSLSSLAPCERCSQKHLINWLTYILLSHSFRGAFATTVFAFAGTSLLLFTFAEAFAVNMLCGGVYFRGAFAAHVFWGSFAKLFRELSRPAIFLSRRHHRLTPW